MRYLIRTCPWDEQRYQWATELAGSLPHAELIEDAAHDGWATMLRALECQGSEDAWHFEDDVILTSEWLAKAAFHHQVLAPNAIIQGFDAWVWPHPGASSWSTEQQTFLGAQCFFLPGAFAAPMLEHGRDWEPKPHDKWLKYGPREDRPPAVTRRRWYEIHFDHIVRAWLEHEHRRYWIAVPSLAQHRQSASLMNPRRDKDHRPQSKTFVR